MPPVPSERTVTEMGEKVGNVPKNTYSQSYRRLRRETRFDTLDLASRLKHLVSIYVMNEKRVPKRWRYMVGKPTIDYARTIRDCISAANDIRIDGNPTGEALAERAALQRRALSYCNILQLQLIDITEECDGATPESVRAMSEIILDLTRKIPRWAKSDGGRPGG